MTESDLIRYRRASRRWTVAEDRPRLRLDASTVAKVGAVARRTVLRREAAGPTVRGECHVVSGRGRSRRRRRRHRRLQDPGPERRSIRRRLGVGGGRRQRRRHRRPDRRRPRATAAAAAMPVPPMWCSARPAASPRRSTSTPSPRGTGGFKIQGQNAGDDAGWSVSSAGDVNGDGIDDLIVGASDNSSGGSCRCGLCGVRHDRRLRHAGRSRRPSPPAPAASRSRARTPATDAGYSVSAAGDVNGDGIDDLIVGAQHNGSGGSFAGAAYVVFGRTGGLRHADRPRRPSPPGTAASRSRARTRTMAPAARCRPRATSTATASTT